MDLIADALPMQKMRTVMAGLRDHTLNHLGEYAIANVKDYLYGTDGLPVSDVISLENTVGDKAIIRPSGTESKVKVYLFARGASKEESQHKLSIMTQQFNRWIQQ